MSITANCPAGFLDYKAADQRGNTCLYRKTLNRKHLPKDHICLHLELILKQNIIMVHLLEENGKYENGKINLVRRTRIDANVVRTTFYSDFYHSKFDADFFKLLQALITVTQAVKIEYCLKISNSKIVELKIIMPKKEIAHPTLFLQQLLLHVNRQLQKPHQPPI